MGYLGLGSAGMSALTAAEPAFCRWSAYQALLAVVANNFGTFAGTLVIQRRTTQKQAGIFNAIGLMIPVLNIFAFLAITRAMQAGSLSSCFFLLLVHEEDNEIGWLMITSTHKNAYNHR